MPLAGPHPLTTLFQRLARGRPPVSDGKTEAMPRPAGAGAAVLTFTGHCVVAADVDPAWVVAMCPPGDLLACVAPAFLLDLAHRTGTHQSAYDLTLMGVGEPGEPWPDLKRLENCTHPRARRSLALRTDVRVYTTAGGAGLLTLGRGLANRWECGFEVEPTARNRGLGRALAAAARRLIPPGDPLFLQVAPGNAASLRAVLRAGYNPIGAEVLFMRDPLVTRRPAPPCAAPETG